MDSIIGMATWLLGKRPLAERIRWLAANGFRAASLEGAQLTSGEDALSDEVLDAIGEADLALTLHLSPGPREPDERREIFLQSVDRAAEMHDRTGRVACVSIDPGWLSGAIITYDPEWSLDALKRIRSVFGDRLVRTAIENWKINPEDEEFRRLADELGGERLGVLLDLGHLHVMNDDAAESAGRLPLDVYEVHVSDNDGSSDDHLPLGKGTLPIEGIAAQLKRRGFDGIWTLEMRPDYHMNRCCITRKRARRNVVATREALENAIELAEAGCH